MVVVFHGKLANYAQQSPFIYSASTQGESQTPALLSVERKQLLLLFMYWEDNRQRHLGKVSRKVLSNFSLASLSFPASFLTCDLALPLPPNHLPLLVALKGLSELHSHIHPTSIYVVLPLCQLHFHMLGQSTNITKTKTSNRSSNLPSWSLYSSRIRRNSMTHPKK